MTAATDESAAGVHARRVIFIDLARALAVIMMVYGHTVSVLLEPAARSGPWYEAWVFQRGLTSSLFLLLSGVAFSIATTRHWASHVHLTPQVIRRLRRFGRFIVLGYLLHLPVGSVSAWPAVTAQGWRAFLAVDVLQLIGSTFVIVQLLVMLTRSRRVFMVVAFALAASMIVFTPAVWRQEWPAILPLALASYLSPAGGSLFPLFPFAASVFAGAGVGQIYARWGAAHLTAFANRVLLGGGAALAVLAIAARAIGVDPFGPGGASGIPGEFAIRTGVSLVILGGLAHASRRIANLPHVFGAVAQESLLIYFVHLCIVYGSVWNHGLAHYVGPTLAPIATLPFVVAIVAAMVLLAWVWNRLKHTSPRAARWTMAATAAVAAGLLLV